MKLQISNFKLQRNFKLRALKFGVWCFFGFWSLVLGVLGVAIITAIRLYQVLISPLLASLFGPTAGCRYSPTCSCYAREAIQTHGAIRGSWLAAKRVCRCHPWGGSGQDPVPHFPISDFKPQIPGSLTHGS
jgi:putative membrane protein insertion efficiency factor